MFASLIFAVCFAARTSGDLELRIALQKTFASSAAETRVKVTLINHGIDSVVVYDGGGNLRLELERLPATNEETLDWSGFTTYTGFETGWGVGPAWVTTPLRPAPLTVLPEKSILLGRDDTLASNTKLLAGSYRVRASLRMGHNLLASSWLGFQISRDLPRR